jgi:hypothetical protein
MGRCSKVLVGIRGSHQVCVREIIQYPPYNEEMAFRRIRGPESTSNLVGGFRTLEGRRQTCGLDSARRTRRVVSRHHLGNLTENANS